MDGYAVGWVRFTERMEALSCAILNGGDSTASAMFIMQVPKDYDGTDPAADAARVRDALGLPEDSVGMMTAAEVDAVFNLAESDHNGVEVAAVATAGLSNHVVAGEELENYAERRRVSDRRGAALAGTINTAVVSPVPLTMQGKVNIMIPMVEAKSAAMADRGFRETGTTSDSMAVFSPIGDDRVSYTGTGSLVGISAARAVRSAVGYALEARNEHPVMEEPFRLLRNVGISKEEMAEMSGSGMDPKDFANLMEVALGESHLRGLLDLALFCGDHVDSLAADGETADRDLMLILTRGMTGHSYGPDEGIVRSVVGSIARYIFD